MKKDYLGEIQSNWVILLAAFITVGVSVTTLPFYTAGLFMGPLEREFGWTRSMSSSGGIAVCVGMAIAAPIVGRLLDRMGTKRVAVVSMATMVCGYFLLSVMPGFYALFLLIWFFMGLFGLGASALAMTRLIGTYFDRALGLALGFTLAGGGIAAMLAPVALGAVIEHHGWRAGYGSLALLIALLLPINVIFREGPQVKRSLVNNHPENSQAGRGFLSTPLFIKLVSAFSIMIIAAGGVTSHFIPLLVEHGFDARRAAELAGLLGLFVLLGRITAGYLLDHFSSIVIAVSIAVLCGAACLIILNFGPVGVVVGGLVVGIVMGTEFDLMSYMVMKFYGLDRYGRVYGALFSVVVIATGLSPLFIGILYDFSGNYRLALAVSFLLLIVAALLFFSLKFDIEKTESSVRKF